MRQALGAENKKNIPKNWKNHEKRLKHLSYNLMMCLVRVFAHKGREGLEVDAMVKGLEISVAALHDAIPLQQ